MSKRIPITLDKERGLTWTINAIADATEVAPSGVRAFLAGTINVSGLRALLWGMLKAEAPTLTLQRVGDLIDEHLENGGDIADLVNTVQRAIEASGMFRKAEDPDPEEGNGVPEAGKASTSGTG